MTSHIKQLLRKIDELPSAPVRPSRMGYWPCPKCGTINRTIVAVTPDTDGNSKTYKVPERVGCRSVFCTGNFETLDPT